MKILRKRWAENRDDILSLAIFKMDLIESFKYRAKQTWIAFFVALVFMAHIGWLFCVDMSHRNEIQIQVILLVLFYLPSVLMLLFWFRAFSIYDFSVGWGVVQRDFFTKKQTRASLIFKLSFIVFLLYIVYSIYLMAQIT